MITYKIEVLPIDLIGQRNNGANCPIALAVKRMFPGEKINVGSRILTIGERNIMLPNMAQEFITKWDNMESVPNPTFYVNL